METDEFGGVLVEPDRDEFGGVAVGPAPAAPPPEVPQPFLHRLALGMMIGESGQSPADLRAKGFEDFDVASNTLNQFKAGLDRVKKGFQEPFTMGGTNISDVAMGAYQAATSPLSAAFQAVGGAAEKASGGIITGDQFNDALMIADGVPGQFARVRGGAQEVIGHLPTAQDFSAAGKVLGSQNAEANLKRMWSEDGIHPAEAVHDAQGDAFLKHQITAKQEEIRPQTETDPVAKQIVDVTNAARGLGSLMDIAEAWRNDPEATLEKLDNLRTQGIEADRALMKKYGVKAEDLEDAPLTDQERHFSFYEEAPVDRERIDEIRKQLQPVSDLNEAAQEMAYEFKRLPKDTSRMSYTDQLAVMRLQVLFGEVERLGGNLNEVIKKAGGKYASRFGDPEDAGFMAENAAESLRNLFKNQQEFPAQITHVSPDLAAPEEMEEAFGPRASLSAAITDPAEIPLDQQPARPPGSLIAAAQGAADKLFDIGRDIQMKLTPMAQGSVESMATVKDYMNSMRRNAWDSSRIDTDLMSKFSADQRERMARAMEEESLSRRLGEPDSAREHQGLATLEPEERAAVEQLDQAQQLAWLRARDAGVVEGDGIPMHFPRMAIGAKGDSEIGKPPSLTQMYGIRKNSPYTKQRQYMEAEETENALKIKYGDQAKIAWDIRAVNLATKMLEDATAGRTLINNIEDVGKRTGEDTVATGFKPAEGWWTVDHPAFYKWRPKFGDDGAVLKDAEGNPQFEQVPIYVRGDFEGPLRAALWGKSGAWYQGMMAVKGKTMGLIMNSPMIHNLVEFGRAFPAIAESGGIKGLPALPIRAVKIYFDGNRAKNDIGMMHEAIGHGLVPIGKRFFNQDINAIMEAPDLTPGRSWTAKILSAVPGLFDEAAGTAVKQAIDKAGDFWHNTLLWDRVGDLQMGLYKAFRDERIAHGMDPDTSSYLAAHWANRFAGALPKEAMSEAATKVSNFMLFSRSFTFGNLGVMKDMLTGLPKDVLAQIERDAGFKAGSIEGADVEGAAQQAVTSAKSVARRKAMMVVGLDIGLMYAGNSLLQNFFHYMNGASWSEEEHDYMRRFSDVINDVKVHPLSLLNPFYLAGLPGRLSSTAENEPGRQNRVQIGYAKDGTAIYARNPVGKIGDEFAGYFDGPLDMMRKKEGTIARPITQIFTNDAGFGRKIYDPHAETATERAGVIWAIVKHLVTSQLPMGQIQAAHDLVTGDGDKFVNLLQAAGPFAGVTFSKGAPGGPKVGEYYANKERFDFRVAQAMPDIRRQILRGDLAGAQQRMTQIGMDPGYQRWVIKTSQDPRLRLSAKGVRDFYRTASPEARARMDRLQQPPQQP